MKGIKRDKFWVWGGVCKLSEKGKKRRKYYRSIKKEFSDIEKEKQQIDSYLASTYWEFYVS